MTQEMVTSYEESARFAAIAVSKDETRYFMQHCECVEYNGSKSLVSTDGRRLHIAPINCEDLEIGNGYEPVKVLKNSVEFVKKNAGDYQFPNFNRVIPDKFHGAGSAYAPIELDIPAMKSTKEIGNISRAYAQLIRWLPETLTVSLAFFADIAGDTYTVKLDSEKAAGAVVFYGSAGRLAVIAPMQCEPMKTIAEPIAEPEPTPEPEPEKSPIVW